ncbi:MAG: 30S ribosomal protein S4 [Rickettsia endosymbiont of Culicoides impunctatus]|uniref:30S ribosomal protein S4 n=1 Tax=unclassified Candidatus Tisiphia TaxID=2996318 RepID=UPI001E740894|nr:30S ribosomal protein S4 [Rickettsia endosymbiont of Platyusa sonomae]MCC8415871.1 30S ribosomal protein S4 [Rickettsia endosymbiont of Gnoriste bilineata]UCM85672.1 MAG: 30S ribosomal protein S4 [Rickettsia endosymbiont of Culicoides impunctatus]
MTKIISSKYKASRRLGVSLWGDSKDAFNTRNYRPGQHGQNSMVKTSDYGVHLKAKQKLKCHYGRINEKQFRNTFALAQKMKGNTGENFIGLLERRLDAVIYRMNIAPTIFAARQFVTHGHIKVNGKKVDIPSMRLKEGDVIELKESAKQIPVILETASKQENTVPGYLTFDAHSLSGKFVRIPVISDVPYPFEPEVHLVIELYSR